MKHARLAVWVLGCALPMAAGAQQLYRCGNTFSQTPCGSDAKALRSPSAGGGEAPASGASPSVGGGGQACAAAATNSLSRSDGSTLRVDKIEPLGAEVIQYAQQPMSARKYMVSLTAFGPNGTTMGQLATLCYLSEDNRRVLKLTPT